MSHLLTGLTPVAAHEIAAAMKERIDEARAQTADRDRITRITIRVENDSNVSLLRWLEKSRGLAAFDPAQFYWSDRDRVRESAALGSADTIEAPTASDVPALFDRLEQTIAQQADSLSYFGGCRFDLTTSTIVPNTPWSGIPTAKFVLPRFELVRYADSLLFACNLKEQDWHDQRLSEIFRQLETLSFTSLPEPSPTPRLIERRDFPDAEAWSEMLKRAGDLFDRDILKKIVLARHSSLSFEQSLSPWSLLEHLQAGSDHCYLFGIQFDDDTTFIGSSPERLYRRDGLRLQTEAIAGTRPRGMSEDEDARLAGELRTSEKDAREHRFVLDGITESLTGLDIKHKFDPTPTLLSLSRVHHLSCKIIGKLTEHTIDRDLIMALHPTPAVGGYPGPEAVAQIHSLEPFDRGWYAGPIGWLGPGGAEFAVGIRSALVRGSSLHLFAGAGIVPGSDPESEWREVETKIGRFISVVAGTR